MKWPFSLTLIRHDTSAYNILKDKKQRSPLYRKFLASYNVERESDKTRKLALQVQKEFALGISDAKTPLADEEGTQALSTGMALAKSMELPHVVFVSPYMRARMTLLHIQRGWPGLASVKTYEEERIREQEHGLSLLYNDWRVFNVFHPEQEALREQEGSYWYRYPQGENVPDVRERNRSWFATITRDFSGQRVLAITHHLNILAIRANLERMNSDEFVRLDKEEKPINCGVTIYRGMPDQGKDGKLVLESYNAKHY